MSTHSRGPSSPVRAVVSPQSFGGLSPTSSCGQPTWLWDDTRDGEQRAHLSDVYLRKERQAVAKSTLHSIKCIGCIQVRCTKDSRRSVEEGESGSRNGTVEAHGAPPRPTFITTRHPPPACVGVLGSHSVREAEGLRELRPGRPRDGP